MLSAEFLFLFFGISVLMALICSRGATLIKSPLIVGYIVAGALLGPDIIGFIKPHQIKALDMINTITLSFIGFGIGGELKIVELKKLGKSIITIVFWEATAAFLLVGTATALMLHSIPLGLIFGALGSATAPAGTVEVIRQYKAKGKLTTTLYAVMGLDDIYALLLYTIATPLAIILLGGGGADTSILSSLGHAGMEIVLSIGMGGAIGFVLIFIAMRIHDHVNLFFMALGVIFITCGLSEHFMLSPILMNMAAGIVAVNYKPMVSRKIFTSLGAWTPPFYVWFFVLIGTRLDHTIIVRYGWIVLVYIIARSVGKWGGAFVGGRLSNAIPTVQKYLGLALFSQAGVAIGLALAAAKALERYGLHDYANEIISVITATTFIVMLIGPVFAKIALFKSGEARVKE